MGERLKKIRKDAGLTQVQLAEKLGFSQFTIAAMETERTQPTIQTIRQYVKIFGVTADYIIGVE